MWYILRYRIVKPNLINIRLVADNDNTPKICGYTKAKK